MYTACGKEIRVEGGGGYRDREYGRVRDDGGRGIPAFVEAETTVAALETRMAAAETMMAAAETTVAAGEILFWMHRPRWPRQRCASDGR
jgi:hypothetical protein